MIHTGYVIMHYKADGSYEFSLPNGTVIEQGILPGFSIPKE
ncbi:unnamed protein product [marine sediment metagenome]|uniref:Uncharacterized protein n=1 Tax=marine sediment metagenome TaxID=412755 RepID=X1KKD9_9ZZZZ